MKDYKITPIEALDIVTCRTVNSLRGNHIDFIGELVQKSEIELRKLPGFGCHALRNVIAALSIEDLTLNMDLNGWSPSLEQKTQLRAIYDYKDKHQSLFRRVNIIRTQLNAVINLQKEHAEELETLINEQR